MAQAWHFIEPQPDEVDRLMKRAEAEWTTAPQRRRQGVLMILRGAHLAGQADPSLRGTAALP
jgi:hypothetical protein